MAVILHFKDGTSATVSLATNAVPYPGDDNFIQCVDGQPIVRAVVPVVNLDWAEISN